MTKTDHLAKAKDYIAIADSDDSEGAALACATDEIRAAKQADPKLTNAVVALRVGKSESWVTTLLQGVEHDHAPFGGPKQDVAQSKSRARKALRDPELRRQVIESLEPEERAELVRDVARTAPVGGVADREYERELAERVEKAPDFDLSAQASKLVATASQLEVLLADGAEFKRLDAKGLQRMDRDLERVKDTADKLREQVTAQSRVRRVA